MSKKEIVSIAIKIFGIYLLIQSLGLAQYTLTLLFAESYGEGFWERFLPFLSILISLVIYAYLGFYMIDKTSKLTTLIVKKNEDITLNLSVDRVVLLEIVFVIVGLFTLIGTAPNLLTNIYHWIRLEIKEEYQYNFNPSNDNLLYNLMKVVFGLLIMTNSNNLANWVNNRNKENTK